MSKQNFNTWEDYIYENGTLKNKLGITDFKKLSKVERDIVEERSRIDAPKGNFDYKHLKDIHKHLFGDIYEWAGKERTVNMTKGGDAFCYT